MKPTGSEWPLLLVFLAGCQSYQARPLKPETILREVDHQRHTAGESTGQPGIGEEWGPDCFMRLARTLSTHGPALRQAREEYRKTRALAMVPTPLPNPELGLGPLLGTDLDPGQHSRRLQPFIEFGFSLPLSGRLAREDDRNRAEAEVARIELITVHRESFLELRRLWMERQMALRAEEARKQAFAAMETALDLQRRLVEAGSATALDLGLLELEAARHEAGLHRARAGVLDVEQKLARLTGLALAEIVGGLETLPPAGPDLPDLGESKQLLLANHPELGRLRARYEVAERNLRLEIARQYPDLRLGTSFAGDPGEKKKVWGLSLGITLPLLDRNQQAIALADGERDAVRARYETTLNEALAELEGRLEAIRVLRQEWLILAERALPKALANASLSRKALAAAGVDALEHLEVERAYQAVMLDALTAELELRRILADLERAIGLPLVPYPGEILPSGYPPLHFSDPEVNTASGSAPNGSKRERNP